MADDQIIEDPRPRLTVPNAVDLFVNVWSDQHLAWDLGPKLTCGELEALVNLLAALRQPQAANNWIQAHVEEDHEDEEDQDHQLFEENE